ncbi:hypothetical protein BJ138DRAFT_108493 [Hygrophoropsis aurantiaca]|uniref:Uncharacterized protein n=1 Tax=Hygrophoropsis aurantiaca TaxID=72124 RepID=A0ACB8ABJ7_9AGAM|nr:hypothetical protein BJ138DRAFT_108493 [Hygrophoropsis aurantiaca]
MSMPSGSMSIDSDMHIRDALALPLPATTNALPREVHAALRRSDRKAGKVLGVTVTRDVAPSQTGLDLLFADHETFGRELEKVRNFSLVGVLKGLNLNIARNRSRARREGRSERVVLGALGDITSVASSDDEKESDGKIISFLPLDHGRSFNHDDELKTPTAGDFDFGSESDDDDEEEEEFVWDCANPFATPPNTPANTLSFELKKRYEARLR